MRKTRMFLLSCLMLPGLCVGAEMAVTRQLSASDAGKTLTSGLYTVPKGTLTLTAAKKTAGLTIGAGQTVYIQVNQGSVLEVIGGAAEGKDGAGAGIYIPKDANLYIFGDGEIQATGGAAAHGGAGGVFTAPATSYFQTTASGYANWGVTTSAGGTGGNGGGGAGAGFGYAGGSGASGGAGGAAELVGVKVGSSSVTTRSEYNVSGKEGAKSTPVSETITPTQVLGRLQIIGTMRVTGTSGNAGAGGVIDKSGSGYTGLTSDKYAATYYSHAARGGYGGAGAGGEQGQGFGLGGIGGGGGGGGGSGGVADGTVVSQPAILYGADGVGGWGSNPGLSGGATRGISIYSFFGGFGGGCSTNQARTGTWTIYKTGTPTITGASSVSEAAAPDALKFKINFNANGKVKSTPSSISAVSAMPYSSCGEAESAIAGKGLLGWYDQPDGAGTCYFAYTTPALSAYPLAKDVTLYPYVVSIAGVETGVTVNGEAVPAGSSAGDGWGCTNCVLTLDGSKESYVLAGTNATGFLSIVLKGSSDVIFNNFSAPYVSLPKGNGVFALEPGVSSTLTFVGENTLKSMLEGKAGIFCPQGASVTLAADGLDLEILDEDTIGQMRIVTTRQSETFHLAVAGGSGAAAIGGVKGVGNGLSGDIIFKDISVTTVAGAGAADVGRGVLTKDHTMQECGVVTIGTGCSVRPSTDTSNSSQFTVDPVPHNEYDLRVWCWRYFDGRMLHRFWLPSSETEIGHKESDGSMTYKVKVMTSGAGSMSSTTW